MSRTTETSSGCTLLLCARSLIFSSQLVVVFQLARARFAQHWISPLPCQKLTKLRIDISLDWAEIKVTIFPTMTKMNSQIWNYRSLISNICCLSCGCLSDWCADSVSMYLSLCRVAKFREENLCFEVLSNHLSFRDNLNLHFERFKMLPTCNRSNESRSHDDLFEALFVCFENLIKRLKRLLLHQMMPLCGLFWFYASF